jgi:hypothetical protein
MLKTGKKQLGIFKIRKLVIQIFINYEKVKPTK